LTTTRTNAKELGEYVSQAEAARIAGTSRQTIAYRVRKGYFTTKVVAGLVLVLRSEAAAIAASHKSTASQRVLEKTRLRTKPATRRSNDFSQEYVSQAEAARIRAVSEQAIADLIKRGRLTGTKVAGRTLVLRSEVETFIPQPRTGRPPKKKANVKAPRQERSAI